MLLIKYGIYLSSLFIAQLTLCAVSVLANSSTNSENADSNEDVPSEEFWLYMSEFSEDEELLDSEILIVDQELQSRLGNIGTEISSSAAKKIPESSEESL